MSATDAATYPKGTLLETINNPSKGAKISTQTTTTVNSCCYCST
jgi:hypothetical protein